MTVAKRSVGILGGMGPAAGAEFARLFVRACERRLQQIGEPVRDQAFPEHFLAQLPIPDRSARLLSPGSPQTLDPEAEMRRAMSILVSAGARTVAIACNTAHAWHQNLQEAFPDIELLHVAKEVRRELNAHGAGRAGLLATHGTYLAGIYGQELSAHGIHCFVPTDEERCALMDGIYKGVKAGNSSLGLERFSQVGRALIERHDLDALILGCTEIPLVLNEATFDVPVCLIDPASVLAERLALRALPSRP